MKLVAFFLLLAFQVTGQEFNIDNFYPVDAGHSYIEFSVKYMGYAKVKGRFASFSGMIYYDAAKVESTSVTIAIKTESIDTDLEFRDNDLKSDNWLGARNFPLIKFTSKNTATTKTGLDVAGTLTIKNTSREVVLHLDKPSGVLRDVRGDAQVIFTGLITINRNDYGVEGKNWSAVKEGITAVEKEVAIEFSILGKQLKAPNFSNWVKNEQQPPGKLYKIAKDQGVDASIAEFQKLKGENSVNENALIIASRMLLLENKKKEAVQLLEANRDAFPEISGVHFSLGQAYASAGNSAKAKESFDKAVQLDPENVEAIEVLKPHK
jgi:polyisoprenoid-binding protein YceI